MCEIADMKMDVGGTPGLAGRVRRLLSVVVLGGVATACGSAQAPQDVVAPAPVDVQVHVVRATARPVGVEAGGLVQARTTAVVTSRLMAPIREVRVTPGDRVRAGQVLVVLDDRDLVAGARSARSAATAAEMSLAAGDADRQAADAALVLARASHARIAALHERRSATQQELDQATASLRAAEAALAATGARVQQAQAALAGARAGSDAAAVTAGHAVVTAPFAGTIAETLVEAGNMAMPGTPLVRLEEGGAFRLDVRVDSTRAAGVVPGQVVGVTIDAAEPVSVQGTVSEVGRAVAADARTTLVKIALTEDDRLRTGMFGRARIGGPAVTVVAIPERAVVRRGQIASVHVVSGDVARLRLVRLGRAIGDAVEVVSGLAPDERVVVAPPADLADGTRVRTGGH